MKAGITGMIAILLLVLCCLVVYSVDGRSAREKELSDTVSSAVEESMERVSLSWQEAKTPQEKRSVIADFTAGLLTRFGSDSRISLEVLHLDAEQGVLDVRITQEFTHFTGKTGTVSIRNSILLETEKKETANRERRTCVYVIINKGLHNLEQEETV